MIEQAQSTLDKASIYAVQVTQYQLQARFLEALDIQRKGLELLGLTIPSDETVLNNLFEQGLADVKNHLAGRDIEDLIHLSEMHDPQQVAAMQLLLGMWYASYLCGQMTLNAGDNLEDG